MADTYAPESAVRLRLCLYPTALFSHAGAELSPRADAQLAIDAGQVRLNGLRTDKGLASDFPVCEAARRQLSDATLGRRQFGWRPAQANAVELRPRRRLDPNRCAQLLELLERRA